MQRVLALILFLSVSSSAFADQFKDGWNAYCRKDYTTAIKLLKPVAAQGNSEAQMTLGKIYYYGFGVEKNYEDAYKFLLPPAEKGDVEAEKLISHIYRGGPGVSPNNAEAFQWSLKAAQAGDADSQIDVALMYRDGKGVEKNNEESDKWEWLAADNGNWFAQETIATSFIERDRDYVNAYVWYSIAGKSGSPAGDRLLPILEKHMSSEQIEKAKRLAADWKPKPK